MQQQSLASDRVRASRSTLSTSTSLICTNGV
jgi:hypothetical protein